MKMYMYVRMRLEREKKKSQIIVFCAYLFASYNKTFTLYSSSSTSFFSVSLAQKHAPLFFLSHIL